MSTVPGTECEGVTGTCVTWMTCWREQRKGPWLTPHYCTTATPSAPLTFTATGSAYLTLFIYFSLCLFNTHFISFSFIITLILQSFISHVLSLSFILLSPEVLFLLLPLKSLHSSSLSCLFISLYIHFPHMGRNRGKVGAQLSFGCRRTHSPVFNRNPILSPQSFVVGHR